MFKYICSMIMAGTLHASSSEIISHRGGAGLFPENTLFAIQESLAMGVPGIEIDVQLTSDAKIVVFHDFFLKPDIVRDENGEWITRSDIPISSLKLADIKKLKLGAFRVDSEYGHAHPKLINDLDLEIPTLTEVLKLFGPNSPTKLWIEIKTSPLPERCSSYPIALTEKVIEMVEHMGLQNSVGLLSFDWRALVRAREINKEIPIGFLTCDASTTEGFWPEPIDLTAYESIPHAINANGGQVWGVCGKNINREDVDNARKLGIDVNVWTINQDSEKRKFVEWGVRYITTDYPI